MAGAGSLALMVGACSGSFVNTSSEKKAPAKEVRSAASLMRTGDSSLASGETATAARFYGAASQAAPKDPVPKMRLARALQTMGAHSAAIDTYQAALALQPGITDAERGIANSLISLDKPRQAIKLYRAVIAKTGDHRAYNGLGVALDMVGEQKAARKAYRAGLEKQPGNLSLQNNLALSMALAGQYAAAAEMLREVSKSPHATARHRQNLALVYGLSGEFKRAAKVARIDLDTPAITRNLAYYEWLRKQPRSTVKRLLGRGGSAKPATAKKKKQAAAPMRQPASRVYRPISSLGIARNAPRIIQAVERRVVSTLPVSFARLEVGSGNEIQTVVVSAARSMAQPVTPEPITVEPAIAQPVVVQPIVAQPIVERPVVERPVVERPVAQPVIERPAPIKPMPRLVVGKPRIKTKYPAQLRQVAMVTRNVVARVERKRVVRAKTVSIKPKVVFARLGLDYLMGKTK